MTPSWSARSAILLVDDDPFLAHVRKSTLERRFREVHRASDAAQAFILLEDRAFTDRLGLVVVALCQPGFSGPAFVRELTDRLPGKPVLVIGGPGEVAPDYDGAHARFLSRYANGDELLAAVWEMIFGTHARVA